MARNPERPVGRACTAQIGQAVSASAGSVNTMLRLLQRAGVVERRGEPGGRRLWYRIASGGADDMSGTSYGASGGSGLTRTANAVGVACR